MAANPIEHPATVLIGTYTGASGAAGESKGIYAADWDAGTPGPIRLVAEMANPSFLTRHPSLPLVYAASEVEQFGGTATGAVAMLRLQGGGAVLAGTWPSHGTSPCHLATDSRGEYLVAANYSSGTAAVYQLVNGVPAGDAQVLTLQGHGPKTDRQAGPHAHSAMFEPGGDRFWVQDLGSDRLWGFILDRGTKLARPLDPPATILTPGCGPRHLAFHPNGRWAYVINELDSTVIALAKEATTGALAPMQTATTLPENAASPQENYCADIHVSPDGSFLYGSNRGHDSLAVWRIAAGDGRLTAIQHIASGGGHPRNFTLSPDGGWLLCANMHSDTIAVFRRDPSTGLLERTGTTAAPHPVCLLFTASSPR